MTIWIFVTYLAIGTGKPIQATGDAKYAFTTKELCEQSIQKLKGLECIELKVVGPLT